MSDSLLISVLIVCALVWPTLRTMAPGRPVPRTPPARTAVGIGTVSSVTDRITVQVQSVCGERFTGRLLGGTDKAVSAAIRPGVVLLVAFDPTAREQLCLADDMIAVRAAFDQMLVGKGLVTDAELDLIRHGIKTTGVITAARPTGTVREDHREIVLDLMVRRPGGGQFPAHETALVPVTSMARVHPGAVVDAYFRRGDESAVAVCVPPA